MLTFLFWNINKRDRIDILARLVVGHDVDVLVLAESKLKPGDVLNALNSDGKAAFHFNFGVCSSIAVYSAFATEQLREVRAGDRFTIRHLRLPMRTDLLLAAAHLPSKLYQPEESLKYDSLDFADAIRSAEKELGHERTLALGDFNMNPFDSSMISARGFHAVMDRRIAESGQGARTVSGARYPFFYNPMWSLLGDASPGPAGTYYLSGEGHVTYFWSRRCPIPRKRGSSTSGSPSLPQPCRTIATICSARRRVHRCTLSRSTLIGRAISQRLRTS